MKRIWNVALATLALAGTSGIAHADLNENGEVGLPINPTAQVPQAGGFRLQGNYYDLANKASLYSLGAAVRVSDKAPIEVNGAVNYLDVRGGSSKTKFSVGAKYLFTRETDPLGVRVAAGVGYSEYSFIKNTRGYIVASKSFGNVVPGAGEASITGHLGVRYDRFSASGVPSSNKASVYVGAEVPLVRTGEFQALGEIGSKVAKGTSTPYSLGLRYRPTQQPFGATIGIQRLGFLTNRSRVFAQIGYTFGGR